MLAEMKRNDYLNENTIYLDTEVDRDSQVLFCRQLKKLCEKELNRPKKDRTNVKVIISSYGGNVLDFYAMASIMEHYQEKGIIIETHGMGYCMSAGSKLLACGSKGHRYITRYSRVLVHQIQLGGYVRETYQERLSDTEQLKKDWDTLSTFIMKHTKLTEAEILDLTEKNLDVTYDAQTAIEKGFADKII